MRLHHILFFVLLFVLPFQIGFHFWPQWSYVVGLRIDYLSPTIYLTDIFVLLVILSWLIDSPQKIFFNRRNRCLQFLILLFAIINIFFASNWQVAALKWLKIFELFSLGLYVLYCVRIRQAILPLCLGVVITGCLAAAQFVFQADLGPLWLIGERPLSVGMPGIAKTIINGKLLLRPYATFPHPNAMAGFVLIVLALSLSVKEKSGKISLFKKIFLGLGAITIFISFSRSAWLALACLIIYRLGNPLVCRLKKFLKVIYVLIGIVFLGFGYYIYQLNIFGSEAFAQRWYLAKVAWALFLSSPFVGIGLNNFVVKLPTYWQPGQVFLLQPVHNLFLLLLSETGLAGVAIVVYLLLKIVRCRQQAKTDKTDFTLSVIFGLVLILGMTDHYWFTLQQNMLLLTVLLGLLTQRVSGSGRRKC